MFLCGNVNSYRSHKTYPIVSRIGLDLRHNRGKDRLGFTAQAKS